MSKLQRAHIVNDKMNYYYSNSSSIHEDEMTKAKMKNKKKRLRKISSKSKKINRKVK